MERRNFLKKSALAVSTAAIAGIAGSSLNDLFAKTKMNTNRFSLDIITDDPEKAQRLSEDFIKNNYSENKLIKFSEYPSEGEIFGDIVFVNNGKLMNYKTGTDKIHKDIQLIASSLELPKKIMNPSRLKFYIQEDNSLAERFLIFHKNILIKTIDSNGKNSNLNLEGTKGDLILNIDNYKARVVHSSCKYKTCVNSGSISHSGENIVCIPNELVIIGE